MCLTNQVHMQWVHTRSFSKQSCNSFSDQHLSSSWGIFCFPRRMKCCGSLKNRSCLRLDLCQCDLEAFNHALHVQDERVLIGIVLNNVVIHVYQDTGDKGKNQHFYVPRHRFYVPGKAMHSTTCACFTTMEKQAPAHASTWTIAGITIKICPIVPYNLWITGCSLPK